MKKILLTGAGGYVGSVLTRKLLAHGYYVRALDLYIYEKDPFKNIPDNLKAGNLAIFKADIRNQNHMNYALDDIDSVIHLACISNDPSFDLNPELGRSVNLDAFEPIVRLAKMKGVNKFINASSSSVYGVNDDPVVTEESVCKPLTDYSKYKLETENILKKYDSPGFNTVSVRSATVCGYSPRQRLDVIVNILANHAYNLGKITVTGGTQKRPNIHINDLCDFYVKLLEIDASKITGRVFNYGGPNFTVSQIAGLVQDELAKETDRKADLYYTETNDPRSYHISSEKALKELGCAPKKNIEDAVDDLFAAFEYGLLPDSLKDSKYFNIEKMKEINLK